MLLRYRLDMITWSTTIRQADYTYFCKAAIEKYKAVEYPIWIVSDCRRKTDSCCDYFKLFTTQLLTFKCNLDSLP